MYEVSITVWEEGEREEYVRYVRTLEEACGMLRYWHAREPGARLTMSVAPLERTETSDLERTRYEGQDDDAMVRCSSLERRD